MRNIAIILLVGMSTALFSVYNVGDTVSSADNISWTDNYGYSSNIFTEVMKGKPVMIFFGGYG
ncbi:TPA: hypothetical protein DCR49_01870 [Candidatus Delongbacteria bacterium]|nr:MAG: hypothetical protein A2Y39_05530 [Candidatus Delongbacteria bacterium GWF2_40_14]HAQ60742.1 hypothetical protein [Candidatus Delongbacteria bacterium]